MKSMLRKILVISLISLFLLIISIFVLSQFIFSPTADSSRNNEVGDVKIEVKIDDDDRKPIIRSFYLDEYNSMSESEKEIVEDKIDGKVEGDIPCIKITKRDNIHIKFFKNGKNIKLDNKPKIELISHQSYHDDKSGNKIIEDVLKESSNGEYTYEVKRYNTQYEKWFLEYNFVKILYSVNGKSYISVFSVYSSNTEDGTDFFENETLDNPIPAEYK